MVRVLLLRAPGEGDATLHGHLLREGFAVDVVADGATGLRRARCDPYDVLVLDAEPAGLDAATLVDGLRDGRRRPRVLLVACTDRSEERVRALNLGVDDCLGRPFDVNELVARVRALVRRRYDLPEPVLRAGRLELDPAARRATFDGAPLDLSPRELALLEYLLLRRGEVASREEIEDHLYGTESLPASNAVDSAVCGLRGKLGARGRDLVRTRRGLGYAVDAGRA